MKMENDAVININGLTKRYGNFTAVDHLSFEVPKGSICGFLGQNGSGKSTTIKMLLGMVHPSEGQGKVLGNNIQNEKESLEIRRRVAYVAEDKQLYDYMTIDQIIAFTRSFFPKWNSELQKKLLNEFKLPTDRKIKKLSKGMRTQMALLLGLCRSAELLILDEPSEGLDPVINEKVLEILVGMVAEGITVFFSSHHVFEVEQIADHIIMIHKGKLIHNKPLDILKSENKLIKIFSNNPVKEAFFEAPGIRQRTIEGDVITLFVESNYQTIVENARQLSPSSIEVIDLSLKEIFIQNLKFRS